MRIEHVALWTNDLPTLRDFYISHFGFKASDLYHNPKKHFTSCFLSLPEGPRIEVMSKPDLAAPKSETMTGLAHFSLSVGSEAKVIEMTKNFEAKGIPIVGQPRWTGDGYFESVVLDPDGNQIEISI